MKTRVLFSWLFIVLLGTGWTSKSVKAELPFADGERVLFLGDSITQDGRYVALVEAYLWATYPQLHLDIVNAGLSSETVSGMTEPIHPYPRPNVNERLDVRGSLVGVLFVVERYKHRLSEEVCCCRVGTPKFAQFLLECVLDIFRIFFDDIVSRDHSSVHFDLIVPGADRKHVERFFLRVVEQDAFAVF